MSVWSEKSGAKLATLQEGVETSIDLPVDSNAATQVLSGHIPEGMSLSQNQIIGTPVEVPRLTTYRFVIRANLEDQIEDRTFSIEVQGADAPIWQTPEDLLPVGKNETFFILDSSPVDYQLEAVDPDTEAGQTLKYFIANDGGELPPGITLTEDGRLIGVVDPILALEKAAEKGEFDQGRFDRYPYDFAIENYSGFESFYYAGADQQEQQEYALENNLGYDSQTYDFSRKSQVPRKLNRYYQFTVSVSDGDNVSQRTFRIFVVGDDFLRADNVIMQVGTGVFTADNTYLRTPIWITPSDLGVKRANNFITLFLDVLDPNDIPGIVSYDLLPENDDGSESKLPPGTEFDRNTGEVFGRVPYQPAVTRTYKFTVRARRIEAGVDTVQLQQFAVEDTPKNSMQIKINKMDGLSSRAVGRTFTLDSETYIVESIDSRNTDYEIIILDRPIIDEITEGTSIDLGLATVASREVAESQKTFSIQLIGEVDSTIKWLTESDLGEIPSNYISILKVRAETSVPNSFLLYRIDEGDLPPGLELSFFGEITGRVDNSAIEKDNTYQFTVKVQDQFGFSATTRTFELTVLNKDDTLYSNVYYKPLLSQDARQEFRNFVSDPEIFQTDFIYRIDDENFGLQTDPRILVYAGIETEKIEQYVAAASRFATRKILRVRDIKSAVAKEPGTNSEIYEVIYLDVYDPYEKDGKVKTEIEIKNGNPITVDSLTASSIGSAADKGTSSASVAQRSNPNNKIYFTTTIPIETRTEIFQVTFDNTPLVKDRDGNDIEFGFEIGSATNIFYRPDPENTIKADCTFINAGDTKINRKFISNTSNIREDLRQVGSTERDFLPLWMRTAQENGLQELGFTLAIPLAYCKPGFSEQILSAIRVKEFDFRQFSIEVDRFLIDSTEDANEEQYVLFANREYSLV